MKTNVEIKKLFDYDKEEQEIIVKFVTEEEQYDDYGDSYEIFYYKGVDGKTYYNHGGGEIVYASPYNFDWRTNPFEKGGKRSRKSQRKYRVARITAYTWGEDGKFGRNRKLRRRMWPNVDDFRDAEEILPF